MLFLRKPLANAKVEFEVVETSKKHIKNTIITTRYKVVM
jgi:hypothetical protein